MNQNLLFAMLRVIALVLILSPIAFVLIALALFLSGCTTIQLSLGPPTGIPISHTTVQVPPDLVTPQGLTLVCKGDTIERIREIAEYIDAVQVCLEEKLKRKLPKTLVVVYPKNSIWRTDCVNGKKTLNQYAGLADRAKKLTRVRWLNCKDCVKSFSHELLHHAGYSHPVRTPRWPDPKVRRLQKVAEHAGRKALKGFRKKQERTFKDEW